MGVEIHNLQKRRLRLEKHGDFPKVTQLVTSSVGPGAELSCPQLCSLLALRAVPATVPSFSDPVSSPAPSLPSELPLCGAEHSVLLDCRRPRLPCEARLSTLLSRLLQPTSTDRVCRHCTSVVSVEHRTHTAPTSLGEQYCH